MSVTTSKQKYIPNCLRKYRKIQQLKQIQVAQLLGMKSTSVISRWEHGLSMPEAVNVLKLAALYHTQVEGLYIDLLRILREDIQKKEVRALHLDTTHENQ